MACVCWGSVPIAVVGQTPVLAAGPTPLVFDHVTVIDVEQGHRLRNQRVLMVGNRIRAVGNPRVVPLPVGARVVDAQGKYLIPGLWDMHVHIDNKANQFYPNLIASGVTGVREMGQNFAFGTDSFRVWQRQVAAGTRVGPRVYGPSTDDMYLEENDVPIQTPDEIRHVIDSLKAAGVVFLKQHDGDLTRTQFFALAAEARRVGLPFVGHLPTAVTEIEASDSGQRSIEHVEENHQCWPEFPNPTDSLALQRCAPIAAAYVRNDTWFVPTLVSYYYVVPYALRNAQTVVRLMHGFGVRMLAGTDGESLDQDPHFGLGATLLTELEFLAGAGLTPLQALQTATLNPAIFMHATDSLGTIAPGKLADLVLLNANPLTNIENLHQIQAVVANGRYFDRAALDAITPSAPPPVNFNAEPLLTKDILQRLTTFWTRFRQEPDSLRALASNVKMIHVAGGRPPREFTGEIFGADMIDMAQRSSAIAADLARVGLTAAQWEAYRQVLVNYYAEQLNNVPIVEPARTRQDTNDAFLRAHQQVFDMLRPSLMILLRHPM